VVLNKFVSIAADSFEEQLVIYFRNVSLSFLDKKLFDNINWTIHPKSRIGLVGDNGTGKTTLFRAILEQVHLDSGIIDIPNRKQKRSAICRKTWWNLNLSP
jgi:ATPase subunit of ABC transporter with duplicated ATPase domains